MHAAVVFAQTKRAFIAGKKYSSQSGFVSGINIFQDIVANKNGFLWLNVVFRFQYRNKLLEKCRVWFCSQFFV